MLLGSHEVKIKPRIRLCVEDDFKHTIASTVFEDQQFRAEK